MDSMTTLRRKLAQSILEDLRVGGPVEEAGLREVVRDGISRADAALARGDDGRIARMLDEIAFQTSIHTIQAALRSAGNRAGSEVN